MFRQKEEMLKSAIEQIQLKQLRKKEEEQFEMDFKRKLMEKFAEDERLEQYNAMRRKQKEIELKKEVNESCLCMFRLRDSGRKDYISLKCKGNRN